MTPLRVALFTDSHHEANGVARTTRALESYTVRRGLPFMAVHAGPATTLVRDGLLTRLELQRSRVASFGLEHDLRFDLSLWRHWRRVRDALLEFRPDVLHFTGPSDVGQLGAALGHRMSIPMLGSWHTNLHQYASRRLRLRMLPRRLAQRAKERAECETLRLELLFYRIPRVVLAPNDELVSLIAAGTGKPTFRMTRGVDTTAFSPALRSRSTSDRTVNVGYVGRLSPEKSVQVLPELERRLIDEFGGDVRFTIVGEGSERARLERAMRTARFTGVLHGTALAAAYADMDLFVFPSQTETAGNVVLEALASGVPVVAMAQGGPPSVAGGTSACVLTADHTEFIDAARSLVRHGDRRRGMRAAARAHAEGRSWDRIFEEVYRAYALASSLGPRNYERVNDEPVALRTSCK
jgi:glycosyltransferase involved in cell wall biosynthesis